MNKLSIVTTIKIVNYHLFIEMFKTTYNSDAKLWTGLDRLEIYEPSDTLGKIILDALDGPLKVIQVILFILYVQINSITPLFL